MKPSFAASRPSQQRPCTKSGSGHYDYRFAGSSEEQRSAFGFPMETTTSAAAMRRRFESVTEIASTGQSVEIPFGQALVFADAPPTWSRELLAVISELGNLDEGWDSYGARPIDPHCMPPQLNWCFLCSIQARRSRPSCPQTEVGFSLNGIAAASTWKSRWSPRRVCGVFPGRDNRRRDRIDAEWQSPTAGSAAGPSLVLANPGLPCRCRNRGPYTSTI